MSANLGEATGTLSRLGDLPLRNVLEGEEGDGGGALRSLLDAARRLGFLMVIGESCWGGLMKGDALRGDRSSTPGSQVRG